MAPAWQAAGGVASPALFPLIEDTSSPAARREGFKRLAAARVVVADVSGGDPGILYYLGLRDALAKLLTIPLFRGALPPGLDALLARRAVNLDQPAPQARLQALMEKLRTKNDEDSSAVWSGLPNQPVATRMPSPLPESEWGQKSLWAIRAEKGTPAPKARLGIYTGDIGEVRGVQVLVNSENTLMEMGRVYDPGVSAVIRAKGANWDRDRRENSDDVYRALLNKTAGRGPFSPGTVFMTDVWGDLARQGVKRIAHVAAVEPRNKRFGSGYREVANLGQCVTNVLNAVAREGRFRCVLFPLMGSGNARGAVAIIADTLIYAAVDYLVHTPDAPYGEILFSAYTDVDRDVCTATLDRIGDRVVGS